MELLQDIIAGCHIFTTEIVSHSIEHDQLSQFSLSLACKEPCSNNSKQWLDWIEQGLTSPPTQYRLSGRQFHRSKDPTNSIKVLKEKLANHRSEEAPNPPGASNRVTSEPLKKEKPYHSGSSPARQSPIQQAIQVLYRTIDYATTDATQHFSKTGLGILYPLCTKPTSMMKCG